MITMSSPQMTRMFGLESGMRSSPYDWGSTCTSAFSICVTARLIMNLYDWARPAVPRPTIRGHSVPCLFELVVGFRVTANLSASPANDGAK